MNISTTDAIGLYTKKVVEVYQERPKVNSFLRSFFPTGPGDVTDTLEVSILVERGSEKIAVDVLRGTDGNRNTFTRSTEKIFIPPYYREYFDQTHLQMYERLFALTEISANAFGRLLNDTADHMMSLQNKIERSIELMIAQIFETGIVQLKDAQNIDYRRKAGSMVNLNGAGGYWSVGATNVFNQLQAAGVWLRKNGKVASQRFTVIMGSEASDALFSNTTFLGRQNLFNMKLDTVNPPQRDAAGGIYLGTLTGGPYLFDLYTFPDYYEDPNNNNVLTEYINPKIAVVIPNGARFKTVFAAVPQLIGPGGTIQTGQYIFSKYEDEKKKTREFHIESAPLPIPVQIDTIYTMQVVA